MNDSQEQSLITLNFFALLNVNSCSISRKSDQMSVTS
jgi:hypothetical protein